MGEESSSSSAAKNGAGGGNAAGVAADSGAGGKQASLSLAPRDRSVIYTADLALSVANLAKATRTVTSVVKDAHGYVGRQETGRDHEGADGRSARLTLKVPVDRYPGVLHRLSAELGHREGLEQRARDVTEKVADVDSRVRSARATLGRLRALLDRAESVKEVLRVEKQLSTREADLEALQARQKALDTKTRYATITLRLQTRPVSHVERAGFLAGLSAGWDAFRTMVVGVLTALGAMAPFLLIFGALAYGGWWVYRLLRRRFPAARSSH